MTLIQTASPKVLLSGAGGSVAADKRRARALGAASVLFVAVSSSCTVAQQGATLSLTAFGAVGDNIVDDTAALQKALNTVKGLCLDGEGREYRVRGTLRASGDLCLINAKLRQDVQRFDTRTLISGTCPVVKGAEAIASCGDPAISGGAPAGLQAYLSTRTLLIRPEVDEPRISVTLRNVRIDRGNDPSSGARSEAAAIWIGYAHKVELHNVEITGAGKGFGLMVVDSSNVTARGLNIHDLVWAPYAGDAELTLPRVRAQGWNTAPVREFRFAGQQGMQADGFQGVRVQEQLSCVMIVRSTNVVLDKMRIRGCRARFAEGDLPWQSDGVGIGESSSGIRISRSAIADTWEGIDVVGGGTGVKDIAISGTRIDNSFGYGVKGGYNLRNIAVTNNHVSNSGLAGVVFYGPVTGASIMSTKIDGVGSVRLGTTLQRPWQQERAGVLIEQGSTAGTATSYPQDVRLENVEVTGEGNCRFGLLNITPTPLRKAGITVTGCENGRQDIAQPPG